jgi:uncharacterized protein (TIGR02118 family)
MIKVSVMYPNTPGARFNHEYYRDQHMPMVKSKMGAACTHYTVDKGLAGGAPGAPATYIGMCHIFSPSVEAFQAGFGPHRHRAGHADQRSGGRLKPTRAHPRSLKRCSLPVSVRGNVVRNSIARGYL